MKYFSPKVVASCIRVFRICGDAVLYVTISLLVFFAVSLSLIRVLLPNIDNYKSDVELWVSELIGQQIEIATLDAAWYGMEPQLLLRGVQVLSDDRKTTLGYFQQARLGIDLFSSAIEGRVRPGAFTLEGARFVLIRYEDGRISLEGFSDPKSSNISGKNKLLEEWFFKQRLLDIKNSEIVWLDLTKSKKVWTFKDVALRFRNDDQRHWINGSVILPDSLGSRIDIALDARGNLLSTGAWSGNAFLSGDELHIAQIANNLSIKNLKISNGDVDLRLWSQWRKGKLYSVQGNVEFSALQMAAKDAPKIRVINKLSGNIQASSHNDNWEITIDKIIVESNRRNWPQTRLDLKYDQKNKSIISEVSYLKLDEVLPIAALFLDTNRELSKAINGLKAQGAVSNLNLKVDAVGEGNNFLLKGGVSDLGFRSWGAIPGVHFLEGQFQVSNSAFEVSIPSQNFVLDYRQMFSYKHDVKNFTTSIISKFDDEDFQLLAKDVKLNFKQVKSYGSFSYQKVKDQTSNLDLSMYFDSGLVSDVAYYLPTKSMPKETVDWLTHSLLAGEIENGGLLYYGDASKFPFSKNDGVFNVNLPVKKGELNFDDEWPLISEIDGVFDLNANSLSFFGSSAKSMDNVLNNVQIDIPDYRALDKQLTILGNVSGSTANKLSYVLASPVGSEYASQFSFLSLGGDSELVLDISIPLSTPEIAKTFGELQLLGNSIFAEKWKLDLNDVSANLRFNDNGIWSDDLTGKIKTTELHGSIETVEDEKGKTVHIKNSSVVTQNEITELMGFFIDKESWGQYLEGETEIQTDVFIPLGSESEKLEFTLQSNLEGMQVNLPYPLKKNHEESTKLQLYTELTGEKRLLQVNYGTTSSIFETAVNKETHQIRRGGIGFKKEAELPDEIGYRFSGKLKEFAWTEWEPLLLPSEDAQPLLDGTGSPASIYFDLEVEEFAWFGNEFGLASIQASHTSQLWSLHVSGEKLEGQIFVPVVMSSGPMVVDMTRLYVAPSKEGGQSVELDPRDMPEIQLKVADFKYGDIAFGSLEVNADTTVNGVMLDTFIMKSKNTTISAKGDWLVNDEKQKSQFEISIDSKNMGEAIKSWGYADAIGGGKGKINLNVSWPGKPSDFDFEIANGDMAIELKDSSMLGFELGAARMVGLLLPRRLLLDFRDVFKKGMHFDEIKGKYQIQDGDAFTSGLFLAGPVADIHLAGRVGLSKRDYDQVVTVNRRIIGDTIPVALLAVLSAQPLIAAQVYIFQQMFAKQIDDILSIQYTVAGSWDEPVITPVIKNPATGEDLTDDVLDE